jgi:hypothetical protein
MHERLLELLVYAPAGLVVTAVGEFPRLAEIGRQALGSRVSSARVIGEMAVRMGRREVAKRSGGVRGGDRGMDQVAPTDVPSKGARALPSDSGDKASGTNGPVVVRAQVDGNLPDSGDLAIPAFDTLSASQVVRRLDGLSRTQLVAARAYEAGTRGRRTIINRIDQLLDERA